MLHTVRQQKYFMTLVGDKKANSDVGWKFAQVFSENVEMYFNLPNFKGT